MKTKSFVAITKLSSVLLFISTSAFATTDAELRRNCEQKRDANACYEVGMSDVRKNTATSRKLARRSLKRACSIQKGKTNCSKEETKSLAKAFLANQGRIPASKSSIKAPKIQNPGSHASTTPYVPDAPHYEPPPSPPAQVYEPAPPMMQAPPIPPPPSPGGQCMPGDPSCMQ